MSSFYCNNSFSFRILLFATISLFFIALNPSSLSSQCGYVLVFDEEFDGSTLDLDSWDYQLGDHGWGNNELQNYTDTNATVSSGTLKITATEPSSDYYESSRIRTQELKDFKYGKIEASIKLPEGQGIWPAFWMLPTCNVYGGWPASGEIDIMEYLGHDTNTSYMTCHFGNSPSDKSDVGTSYDLPTGDFTDDFYLFGIEWSHNEIKWYIDGNLILTVNDPDVSPYHYPFNDDFHLLLNVAVGGNWPGDPDETTVFPQTMEVDYVKVYQYVEDIHIKCDNPIFPNTTGHTISIPEIEDADIQWSTPTCATLVSGQGTETITMDWTTDEGSLDAIVTLPCSTFVKTIDVDLHNSTVSNFDFEKGKYDWTINFFNGADGSSFVEETDNYEGDRSLCVVVTDIDQYSWEAQMNQQNFSVVGGDNYTLNFYAKADSPNTEMRVDLRNTDDNSTTGNQVFTLSDQWSLYTMSYTAPYTITNLAIDFNLGIETGTFCFDAVEFLYPSPAIGLCPTQYCIDNLDLGSGLVMDTSFSASDTLHSSNLISNNALQTNFEAGVCIDLESGFEVESGSVFTAKIEDCNSN